MPPNYSAGVDIGALTRFYNQLTGQSLEQRQDRFIKDEFPQYANRFLQAQTEEEIAPHVSNFISAAANAGFGPNTTKAYLDLLAEPARVNFRSNRAATEIGNLRGELEPKTVYTDKPVNLPPIKDPFGQGVQGLERNDYTVPTAETRPGRPFSQADALRLAEIEARTGFKTPSGMSSLIATPSLVGERESGAEAAMALASRRKTQRQIEERQLRTLEDLPEEEIGTSGISPRTLGLATKGSGLTQYATQSMPQREKQESETDVELKKSQITRNKAQAARYGALTKQAGGQARMSAHYNEFVRLGGDPDDEEGFLSYVERRTKAARKPDFLESYLQNRGGASRSTAPGGKRQGPPTAQSVLEKFGVK